MERGTPNRNSGSRTMNVHRKRICAVQRTCPQSGSVSGKRTPFWVHFREYKQALQCYSFQSCLFFLVLDIFIVERNLRFFDIRRTPLGIVCHVTLVTMARRNMLFWSTVDSVQREKTQHLVDLRKWLLYCNSSNVTIFWITSSCFDQKIPAAV